MKAHQPKPKKSEIKPSSHVPSHLWDFLSQVRCYVWKYEEPRWNKEKQDYNWSKPARSPKTSRHRKIRYRADKFDKDVDLWGTFEEAHTAFLENQDELQGVGFLVEPEQLIEVEAFDFIESGDPMEVYSQKHLVIYCDFDDCRDPYSGELDPWVREQIEKQNTYTEVSPSGRGIRTIGWGKRHPDSYTVLPKRLTGGRQVEVYGGVVGKRHLITFTGVPLEGFDKPINNIQDWIDAALPLKERHEGAVTPEPLDLSEEELLQKMLSSQDNALIERFMDGDESLWEGEGARYESRSHADQGFLRKLAFWTRGDRERMRKIALSSRMRRRDKWNRKGYLDNLIDQGISYCGGKFYDPHIREKAIGELYHLRLNASWNNMNACHLLSGFLSLAYMYGRYKPGEGVYVYGSVRNLNLRSRIVNPDSKDHITITKTWRALEEMGYIKEISKGGSMGEPNKASLYLILEPTHTSTPSEYIHIEKDKGGWEEGGCLSPLCMLFEGVEVEISELTWFQKLI